MPNQLVVFRLTGRRFGVELPRVERIVRAAAVTGVPHAPRAVAGVLNVQGEVMPVINLRELFGSETSNGKEISSADQFILARAVVRSLALWVEEVEGVLPYEPSDRIVMDEALASGIAARRYFAGAVKSEGEIILICDLDQLLSPEESRALQEA